MNPAGAYTYHGSDAQMVWYPNEPSFGADITVPAGIVLDIDGAGETVEEKFNRIKYPGIRANKFRKKDRNGNRSVTGSTPLVGNISILAYLLQPMLGAPTEKTALTPWETFRGSGLDDLTIGGTFTGSQLTEIVLQIAAAGTPDTYKYSTDGGATWSAPANITAGPDALTAGITATFAATTGHTAGDTWLVYVTKQIGFLFQPDFVTDGYPPTGKLERGWPTMGTARYLPYSGMRPMKLTLPLTSEWDGRIDIDWIGRNQETEDTSPLDAAPVSLTDDWLGGSTMMLMRNGLEVYDITALTFSIGFPDMKHNTYPVNGGNVVRSLPISMMDVMATMKVSYESGTLIQAARDLTNVDLGIRIHDLGSTTQSADIRCLEGTLEPVEAHAKNEDVIVDYTWHAHYETGDLGTLVQAIVDCGLATGALDGPA